MTDTANLYDAKTNLSKLVDRAAAGEEIVIAKPGKPKAKLVPYQPPPEKAPVRAELARHHLYCR
jgi:prevent-host-death family protein